MILQAGLDNISQIIDLRIELLKAISKKIDDYNWDEFRRALDSFYMLGMQSGDVAAFLSIEDSKCVGVSVFCFYRICPMMSNIGGKVALLSDMYVLPEYRKQGIGSALLARSMDYAKAHGYPKVILNASADRRKIYEKYGFINNEGEMYYKFGHEEDLVTSQNIISAPG